MKTILLTILAFGTTLSVAVERFDNFTVYRLVPKNTNELNVLAELQNTPLNGYDFWTYPKGVGMSVDILVSPQRQTNFKDLIHKNEIQYEVLMENIQEQIDAEAEVNKKAVQNGPKLGLTWDRYYRLNDIYEWLRSLSVQYPGIVTLVQAGRSYQGRQILGVKLSFRPGNQNRGVWIDSLIHAREWISGATVTYILNQLLTSTDPSVRQIAESHDWYIVPVLNPDGYEFSHTNNRMWRKTRTPYSTCFGADPNRNWGYRWNTGGSSNNPCSETYAGPRAFSEVETESVSQYIRTIGRNLQVLLSVHSYSQLLLIPYGHTTQHLENYNQVRDIGLKAAQSLSRRYGTRYTVGNGAEILYIVTGASDDWAKANFQIPVVLTYELRDLGSNGFLLPANQIIPSGLETLDSLVTLLQESDKIIPTSNSTLF